MPNMKQEINVPGSVNSENVKKKCRMRYTSPSACRRFGPERQRHPSHQPWLGTSKTAIADMCCGSKRLDGYLFFTCLHVFILHFKKA